MRTTRFTLIPSGNDILPRTIQVARPRQHLKTCVSCHGGGGRETSHPGSGQRRIVASDSAEKVPTNAQFPTKLGENAGLLKGGSAWIEAHCPQLTERGLAARL